jgi:putative endonuclease
MYVVYILRTNGNTLYTGQTNNLEKRLIQHREGKGAKYMRKFKYFILVYTEEVSSLSLALKREWEIKKMVKVKKEDLVRQGAVIRDDQGQSSLYFDGLNSQRKKEVLKKQK